MLAVFAALAVPSVADAEPRNVQHDLSAVVVVPKSASQGVAVLGIGATRDDAFKLARTVYASALRPRTLDELRARVLAGDPAPPAASKEVRELAELRASITGDDAASRRLMASIAQEVGVEGILVVSRSSIDAREGEIAGSPEAGTEVAADAGAIDPAPSSASSNGPRSRSSAVTARIFLPELGDFDAARYEPDTAGSWNGTVASISSRFPARSSSADAPLGPPPPKLTPESKDHKPFYASPWLWGALGAAALIGGFFYFASRDTSDDPIHLQLHVPR